MEPSAANSERERVVKSAMNAAGAPIFLLEELMGEHNEVLICHAGQMYRLSRTRQGKLILTK